MMEIKQEILEQISSELKENLSTDRLNEISLSIKHFTELCREENAKLEEQLSKLRILKEDLASVHLDSRNTTEMLNEAVNNCDMDDFSSNAIALGQTKRLRKHTNYVSKMKVCIKFYMNLNENLLKQLKQTKWELEQSNIKLRTLNQTDEIKQLEEKAKRYDKELLKFEKRYPWLKDPSLNLPNISRETETLKRLREIQNKLKKELSVYQDLKPDLKEAKEQLMKIRSEIQIQNQFLVENV